MGYYYTGGGVVSQLPVGVIVKGHLHGFAALYGIFTVGSLAVFLLSCFVVEEPLKTPIMLISLGTFLVLCFVGILLRLRKPDIFSVKEEYHLTITTEGSKIPNGEIVTKITELDKPRRYPQINNKPKEAGEQ